MKTSPSDSGPKKPREEPRSSTSAEFSKLLKKIEEAEKRLGLTPTVPRGVSIAEKSEKTQELASFNPQKSQVVTKSPDHSFEDDATGKESFAQIQQLDPARFATPADGQEASEKIEQPHERELDSPASRMVSPQDSKLEGEDDVFEPELLEVTESPFTRIEKADGETEGEDEARSDLKNYDFLAIIPPSKRTK